MAQLLIEKKRQLFLLNLLCLSVLTPTHLLADKGDLKLNIEQGLSYLLLQDKTLVAGLGGVSTAVGINDYLWITAQIEYKKFFQNNDGLNSISDLNIGLDYNVDVWSVVPYIGAGFSLFHIEPTQDATFAPYYDYGIYMSFGLDYFLSRYLTLGLVMRYQILLRSELTNFPSYVHTNARIGIWF